MHRAILFIICALLKPVHTLNSTPFDDKIINWSRSIAETFHIAQSKSFFTIDIDKAIAKSLDTFMKDIDAHGSFLAPEDYKELLTTTHGEFYGIGVVLGPKKQDEEFLTIVDAVPNSPAAKNGLKKNDKIISIDGTPVSALSIDEAVKKLKGEERFSEITLNILRDAQLMTFKLKRDIIKEDNLSCFYLPDLQIAYCSIGMFTQNVGQELRDKIEVMKKKKLKGIIIDLRDNPGGVLQAAADCASVFLPQKTLIATTKTKDNKDTETFYTIHPPIAHTTPIVILINNFTASAAEILAGVLQYEAKKNNKKIAPVFLAGTNSHGKGSVQEIIPIAGKCAVKITTSLYYLPNGISINNQGLQPDFVIEPKIELSETQKKLTSLLGYENKDVKLNDEQVDHPVNSEKQTKAQAIIKDHFVQTAINILNIISMGLKKPTLNTHEALVKWARNQLVTNNNITIQEM